MPQSIAELPLIDLGGPERPAAPARLADHWDARSQTAAVRSAFADWEFSGRLEASVSSEEAGAAKHANAGEGQSQRKFRRAGPDNRGQAAQRHR